VFHLLAKHKWTEICRSVVVPVVCIWYWCLTLTMNVVLSKRQSSVWDDAVRAETCSRVLIHILCVCIVLVYENYNYCTKIRGMDIFKTIGWVVSTMQCAVSPCPCAVVQVFSGNMWRCALLADFITKLEHRVPHFVPHSNLLITFVIAVLLFLKESFVLIWRRFYSGTPYLPLDKK